MALKGKPLLLTTSDQDVYVCPATQEASVHALVFSNVTGGAVTISIKRYIAATATTTTLVAALSVSANATYNWPKPMNMAVGDKIIASASANSSIVCDYGAYENSATPAAIGFTGRGAWSSGANYAVNDVVSLNGSSYLAIQAGTNQDPATQTAYWLVLAAKGDTGAVDPTVANTFTAAQTFRAANAIRSEAASTQDAVVIAGRADGTNSRAVTITPASLGANRTVTLPDADTTIPVATQVLTLSGPTAARTVTLPDENFSVGYLNIPQNSQSAAYTLVLADSGKHILHPSADTTARTFTIPANGSVAFPVGTAITFVNQNGAGAVTIAITTDTMRLAGAGTTGSRTLAANGVATAIKITSTEWIISGTGLT